MRAFGPCYHPALVAHRSERAATAWGGSLRAFGSRLLHILLGVIEPRGEYHRIAAHVGLVLACRAKVCVALSWRRRRCAFHIASSRHIGASDPYDRACPPVTWHWYRHMGNFRDSNPVRTSFAHKQGEGLARQISIASAVGSRFRHWNRVLSIGGQCACLRHSRPGR